MVNSALKLRAEEVWYRLVGVIELECHFCCNKYKVYSEDYTLDLRNSNCRYHTLTGTAGRAQGVSSTTGSLRTETTTGT